MSDDYRDVTTRFRGVSASGQAFFVDRPGNQYGTVSLPRSLIHAADDAAIERLFDGEEITFRLRAWKADEVGWP